MLAWPGLEESIYDACEGLRVARKIQKDAFQGIPWELHGGRADKLCEKEEQPSGLQDHPVGR